MACTKTGALNTTWFQRHHERIEKLLTMNSSPKTNTCATCDLATNEGHKRAASEAFVALKKDREFAKSTVDVIFATFDLQKTLPLPRLTTSIAFYLRQIWLYNLGIHVGSKTTSKPHFHIWSEADGSRGCRDIASCLLAWVDLFDACSGCKLICWSYSCVGQNKNFVVLCLWQNLIKTKRFVQIDHKFPIPGHSYVDSDHDFGHIETDQ